MIDGFVAAGFHVVAFDNRDAGLSQNCADRAPYSLRDMAEDTVGLMDALAIDRAHVLGMSMGGMILQLIALHHPARLLSATIVMSSSRADGLPQAEPEVQELLRSVPPSRQRDDVIAHELEAARAFQSPRWPFDSARRATLIGRAYDRCYSPDGASRQYEAMMAAASDLAGIEAIDTPTLVVHGTQDRLLPPAHGRDIAARIPGAEMVEIHGMGHDLEGAVPSLIVNIVNRFVERITMPPCMPAK